MGHVEYQVISPSHLFLHVYMVVIFFSISCWCDWILAFLVSSFFMYLLFQGGGVTLSAIFFIINAVDSFQISCNSAAAVSCWEFLKCNLSEWVFRVRVSNKIYFLFLLWRKNLLQFQNLLRFPKKKSAFFILTLLFFILFIFLILQNCGSLKKKRYSIKLMATCTTNFME